MKRLILPLLIFLFSLAGLYAESDKDFRIEFNDDKYIQVFKGRVDGVRIGTTGELLDGGHQKIGSFTIIGLDDYDGYARLDSLTSDTLEKIRYVSIQSLDLHHIRFAMQEHRYFFVIKDKGTDQGITPKMKGVIFEKGKLAGNFRIIGVEKNKAYGFVDSVAAGGDFREADSGKFQDYFQQIVGSSGFANLSYLNIIMLMVGFLFIYLGIAKDYEPLLLVPIGFGILVGNIPLPLQIFNSISVYMIDPVSQEYMFNTTSNSVLGLLYFGVRSGLFPPLIFLGIGAMTDFTALLANPKSVLLGAAAQAGIFITFLGALYLGFSPSNAAAIGIIGGADGPTAIFLSSRLAPSLIGPIAIAAYSYMAMVPIIQPPIMKLLTTKKERLIRMKPTRKVKQVEKIIFPILGLILTTLVAPGAIPLLGMLFFGNLLKESGVTSRLAKTASNALIDIATILLGFAVGASTSAQVFLNKKSVLIFVLGVISFAVATAAGVLFGKLMNVFSKNKINPLIGAAGVSAVPDSARVVHNVGKEEDPNNYLLMHAMGPNVAGVIGSAIAAGVFLGIF
jgi:sodium ion-translocating decarboxylase beta subunit